MIETVAVLVSPLATIFAGLFFVTRLGASKYSADRTADLATATAHSDANTKQLDAKIENVSKEVNGKLDEILKEVKRTNGRVTAREEDDRQLNERMARIEGRLDGREEVRA